MVIKVGTTMASTIIAIITAEMTCFDFLLRKFIIALSSLKH